jgi:hypothetical protein
MVRHRVTRQIFSVTETEELPDRADSIDEYRELAMLANAWERRSLEPAGAEGASPKGEDREVKELARR